MKNFDELKKLASNYQTTRTKDIGLPIAIEAKEAPAAVNKVERSGSTANVLAACNALDSKPRKIKENCQSSDVLQAYLEEAEKLHKMKSMGAKFEKSPFIANCTKMAVALMMLAEVDGDEDAKEMLTKINRMIYGN